MSIFLLKMIAAFFMVVDHIKYAIPSTYNEFTAYFGRIAFPIFAFCAVQGYLHTSNITKYIKRLLIAGVISEIPFLLFESLPTIKQIGLNIEFTLALGIFAIKAYEFYDKWWEKLVAVVGIGLLASIFRTDYGFYGVFLIFSFYLFRDSKLSTLLLSAIVVSFRYLNIIITSDYVYQKFWVKNWLCALIPLIIVFFYNGKKGPSFKWFFYIFYPGHLLILYLLSPYVNIPIF